MYSLLDCSLLYTVHIYIYTYSKLHILYHKANLDQLQFLSYALEPITSSLETPPS